MKLFKAQGMVLFSSIRFAMADRESVGVQVSTGSLQAGL
jgi:hypothetical protein